MASGIRIPKAELTGVFGLVVKRAARKMFGEVPEPLGMYWHNRKVLNFSFALARKIRKWDQCDENLKTFAHMAVASVVGCGWCLDTTYFQAHKALGPAALVELTTYTALANFMARSNTAVGIESQEYSAACGLKPLAVASAA